MDGLDLFSMEKLGIQHISSKESMMIEAVVRPSSNLLSKTLEEANFRAKFNLSVLAIHRKGKNIKGEWIKSDFNQVILYLYWGPVKQSMS